MPLKSGTRGCALPGATLIAKEITAMLHTPRTDVAAPFRRLRENHWLVGCVAIFIDRKSLLSSGLVGAAAQGLSRIPRLRSHPRADSELAAEQGYHSMELNVKRRAAPTGVTATN